MLCMRTLRHAVGNAGRLAHRFSSINQPASNWQRDALRLPRPRDIRHVRVAPDCATVSRRAAPPICFQHCSRSDFYNCQVSPITLAKRDTSTMALSTHINLGFSRANKTGTHHHAGRMFAAFLFVGACAAAHDEEEAAHSAPLSDQDKNSTDCNRQKDQVSTLPLGIDLESLSLAAGVGIVPGFCAGFALRKVGNLATFLFGGVFFMFQMAAYKGYVTIHWEEVEKDLSDLFDLDNDGKVGKLDTEISEENMQNVLSILTHNTNGTLGGFAGGFFLGWRSG